MMIQEEHQNPKYKVKVSIDDGPVIEAQSVIVILERGLECDEHTQVLFNGDGTQVDRFLVSGIWSAYDELEEPV